MFEELADDYFDEYCRLDPVYATLSGRPGFDAALPDYSPDGYAARAALLRDTLARLTATTLPAAVLRERLTAELSYLDSGLAASLNLVVSPPMLIRTALERTTDPDALRRRLLAVPAALTGYLRTVRQSRPPARRQAEVVMHATRSWAQSSIFGATPEATTAAAGYAEFADALERDVLPAAREEDGLGAEAYGIAARHALGADLDLAETRDWLTDRLAELRAEIATIAPGEDLRAVCATLDADPRRRLDGVEQLRAWARKQLDRSFDLVHGTVLDVPEPLRDIEVVLPDAPASGPIQYLPPAADLSRPGRVSWPVRAGEPTPIWAQLTMIHHEGVPGHHLQVGAAVLDERLPLWQRHTTVYGHAEGWAVYAEGLMAELGALPDPPAHLGYLLGLRANAAVALADIGVHTQAWPPERTLAFLREHTTMPDGTAYFTALRTAAWPGQALTYACGERAWRAARNAAERLQGKDFDPRAWHARMLALGPCGLSVLTGVREPG